MGPFRSLDLPHVRYFDEAFSNGWITPMDSLASFVDHLLTLDPEQGFLRIRSHRFGSQKCLKALRLGKESFNCKIIQTTTMRERPKYLILQFPNLEQFSSKEWKYSEWAQTRSTDPNPGSFGAEK